MGSLGEKYKGTGRMSKLRGQRFRFKGIGQTSKVSVNQHWVRFQEFMGKC